MNLSTVSKKAGHRLFLDLNALTVLSLRLPDNHSPDSRKPGFVAVSRAITGERFELSLPRRNDCHFKISARPPSRRTSTKLKRDRGSNPASSSGESRASSGKLQGISSISEAQWHIGPAKIEEISAYMGRETSFDKAIAEFVIAYADQTERDWRAFVDAIKADRISASTPGQPSGAG
jgi:Uncharacterized protein conserved in bacteria (DUF2252)